MRSNYRKVPELARQTVADKRQRRQRGSISVDEIINGAFEVATEVSVDGLSMPLLAKHLDVGVTSIYWYFRKKDDLLNAMTDRALGQYDFATPFVEGQDWRDSLRNHARKMRQTFRSNPILCDLILIRGTFGREATQAAFAKAGKSDSDPRGGGPIARGRFRYLRQHLGAHPRCGGFGTAARQVRRGANRIAVTERRSSMPRPCR